MTSCAALVARATFRALWVMAAVLGPAVDDTAVAALIKRLYEVRGGWGGPKPESYVVTVDGCWEAKQCNLTWELFAVD